MKRLLPTMFAFALLIQLACTKDKNPTKGDDNLSGDTVVTENIKEKPTFFSIGQMSTVATFDIKFHLVNRSPDLALNSGSDGSAGVAAKNLGVVDFSAAANVDTGFVEDKSGNYVIGDKWYNYDLSTHTVSSKNEIYLVRGIDYKTYKLRIDGFTQNQWTITFADVNETGVPITSKTMQMSATDTEPSYLSLSTGMAITPGSWDVCFLTIPLYVPELSGFIQNPAMRLNSASGVQAAVLAGMEFDDVTSVPGGLTYKQDTSDSLAVGTAFLNYNSQTHILTPPDVVYMVQTTAGKHAKLKITSYYNPTTGASGFVNFRAALLD
jgi:hypothetical protein